MQAALKGISGFWLDVEMVRRVQCVARPEDQGMNLPEWINPELWEAFCDMRRQMKRIPFTAYAQKLILQKLERFKTWGYDPNESLKQSIERGWRGVFPVEEEYGTRQASREQQRTERSQEAIERALGHRSGLADALRANVPGRDNGRTGPALPRSIERPVQRDAAQGVLEGHKDLQVSPDAGGSTGRRAN